MVVWSRHLLFFVLILPGLRCQDDFPTDDELFHLLNEGSPTQDCTCISRNQCGDTEPIRISSDPNENIPVFIDVRLRCPDPSEICCRVVLESPVVPEIHYEPRCGVHNRFGVGINVRNFKKGEAQFGEFPWMAAVLFGGEYSFAGSLIHPSVVLTVAHRAEKYLSPDIVVRLGEWNLNSTSELLRHQERGVSEILMHPRYDKDTLENDYSLLILKSPVLLQPNIDTICLPRPHDYFVEGICYSGGWGKTVYGKGSRYSIVLKEVSLPIVGHADCQSALRTTEMGLDYVLPPFWICAGGQEEDTCAGDGGAPLVCVDPKNPTRFVQVGLVAWGVGCGTKNVPGVYAPVKEGLRWIEGELRKTFGPNAGDYFT